MARTATTEELKPLKDAADAARQVYYGLTRGKAGESAPEPKNIDNARAVNEGIIEEAQAAIKTANANIQGDITSLQKHNSLKAQIETASNNTQVADRAYIDAGGRWDHLQRQYVSKV